MNTPGTLRFLSFLPLIPFAFSIGCGARTDLAISGESADAGSSDVFVLQDAPPDSGSNVEDATIFEDVFDGFVAPDAWTPMCPDSVRIAGREASIPVDTIWALDTSFSMQDDLGRMRDNVQRFWDALAEADIDSHTIFVSSRGSAPPPPAGFSGRFAEVDQMVGSWDPLIQLLNTHRFYESFLRPDAITHFIVVTDDDSRALPWENFFSEMEELLGHSFIFHAIASEQVTPTPTNPAGACQYGSGGADRAGVEYYTLADETGGLQMSICNEDWSELFDLLNARVAVRVPLPCAYGLPTPPPRGIVYEPENFTVLVTVPGEVGPRVLNQVTDEGACGGGGWWYFEGSERIVMCENSCEMFEALDGRVEIDLGCTSI